MSAHKGGRGRGHAYDVFTERRAVLLEDDRRQRERARLGLEDGKDGDGCGRDEGTSWAGGGNVHVSGSGSGEEGDRPSFPVCPGTTLRSAHSQTRCAAGSRSGPCACCLHAPFYRPGLDSGFWSARRTWPRQSYERISRGIETWPHFDCALSRGSVESTLAADMVDRTSSRDVGRTSLPRKDVM